jgi:hypothetical protein
MKFTCGAKSLGSASGDGKRRLTTLSNVSTPSTNEISVSCVGSVRVWRRKQALLRNFVPGVAVANTIGNPKVFQRSS